MQSLRLCGNTCTRIYLIFGLSGHARVGIGSCKYSKNRFDVERERSRVLSDRSMHVILSDLAKKGFLRNPKFLTYLKYLQYWKRPEYARYITYPQVLTCLEYETHIRLPRPKYCHNSILALVLGVPRFIEQRRIIPEGLEMYLVL